MTTIQPKPSIGERITHPRAVQVALVIAAIQALYYGIIVNINAYQYPVLGAVYEFTAIPVACTLLLLPVVAGWQLWKTRGRLRLMAAATLLLWLCTAGFLLWVMIALND